MFEKHTISCIFHKREINNRNTPIKLHDMTFINEKLQNSNGTLDIP